MIVGIDIEILIVGIDVEVRWDLDCGLPMQVDSWLWIGDASSFMGLGCSANGFLLCFLGLSCCANRCCSIFNEFCGRLLMTVVVVVVLFSVFCFAMDYGCHSGGGGGGSGSSVVVVIYCIRYIILFYYIVYIILMCCNYYFNV